jgi:hypothetical protein
MRSKVIFFGSLALLGGCKKISCLLGLVSADGACALPAEAACPDGQLRDASGECRDIEGFEVDRGNPDPPSDDTDVPTDSGDTVNETGDTIAPSGCLYNFDVYTDDYPSEYGIQIRQGRTVVYEIEPGELTTRNNAYRFELELTNGTHTVIAQDTAFDGWTDGYYQIWNAVTWEVVSQGTVTEGVYNDEFTISCE